jgi:catechol 2,3-dioxygenase-like lactoylglutathione lyase family enzyme
MENIHEKRVELTAPRVGLRLKGLDHVTIVVSDLERSRGFYCDVLGMTPIERPAFPFPGAWFAAGRSQVHLLLEDDLCAAPGYPNETPRTQAGRLHHFAFEVDDAYGAAEVLRSHGVRINGGPVARPDGCIQVWFYDPDGHVCEVFHRP